MPTVGDVMDAMERIAPRRFAETRDRERIGLHAGDPDAPVTRVALALDASLAAMEKAAAMRAGMLVVHHPRFYGGIRNLVAADPAGRRGVDMVRRGLA
ncbi:MAG: Nif3-like dinuclear metal center hexameric protein, partial [Planctomycetota bacterium]|nr:Nif3-like dinuclear metal center hexameric protein [Planctomycetota bacterium]